MSIQPFREGLPQIIFDAKAENIILVADDSRMQRHILLRKLQEVIKQFNKNTEINLIFVADGMNAYEALSGRIFTDSNGTTMQIQSIEEMLLVITDGNMPDYNGLEIAELCKGQNYGFPLVAFSGEKYSAEQKENFREFFTKDQIVALLTYVTNILNNLKQV